jgi:hypothetical protein
MENTKKILNENSFSRRNKVNFIVKENGNENSLKKNFKIYESNLCLDKQDILLNMLEDMREFDNKNGTCLFKNIIYNDLKSFILKKNF